jgi:hypothetical protein
VPRAQSIKIVCATNNNLRPNLPKLGRAAEDDEAEIGDDVEAAGEDDKVVGGAGIGVFAVVAGGEDDDVVGGAGIGDFDVVACEDDDDVVGVVGVLS